ncbi:MAG TPA: aldo/keto reductase [Steroidobacteraceae bacterium]|nr:aldo/keto reductase [Steroidobacteraceae bacterium]HEV2443322.1 aldo/keto reductase [Steroidobacteraceae bacterium]
MDYIRFGQTGLEVSQLCLGTMSMGSSAWKAWVLDEDASIPILRRAVDLGINFFDMADWYSRGRNEEVVGRNLLRMTARERLVLATKVFYPMSDDPQDRGLSRRHIATSIDRSLARIGTDYLDLYVIHAFDADTPVEETMEALHATVRAGKVRYLGASTMYTWQFAKMNHVAAMHGWTPFVNMQCQYNLLYREEEREMFPYCRDQGIAVTTFSPLARGFLARDATGTARTAHDLYQEFYGDDIDREIARRVREVAARRGVSPSHVAMAWVAGSPNRNVPIVGASKTAQLDAAVEALALELDAGDRAFLEAPYRPRDEINDQNPVRRPRALPPD